MEIFQPVRHRHCVPGHVYWYEDTHLLTPADNWLTSTLTESLLAGFPVPMLPYMLEERLHNDPSQTTSTTNSLLSLQGLAAILAAPFCAALFDTISNQKIPLYLALVLCLAGTALFAITTTCTRHPSHIINFLLLMLIVLMIQHGYYTWAEFYRQ